jgi:hypothetical protein
VWGFAKTILLPAAAEAYIVDACYALHVKAQADCPQYPSCVPQRVGMQHERLLVPHKRAMEPNSFATCVKGNKKTLWQQAGGGGFACW